jgi:hypothetical protein
MLRATSRRQHIREDDMSDEEPYYGEWDMINQTDARYARARSRTPRQDINAVKAELVRLEAEQAARNLTKAPPNGKEKYLGNGRHAWEEVTLATARLRVPGGWIYNVSNGDSVFVPLPSVLGYAV